MLLLREFNFIDFLQTIHVAIPIKKGTRIKIQKKRNAK